MGKRETKTIARTGIHDMAYKEALACAKKKQEYIYGQCHDPQVMQEWYLMGLVEEYAKSLAFSKFTLDLCRGLRDMEKERSAKARAPKSATIL